MANLKRAAKKSASELKTTQCAQIVNKEHDKNVGNTKALPLLFDVFKKLKMSLIDFCVGRIEEETALLSGQIVGIPALQRDCCFRIYC